MSLRDADRGNRAEPERKGSLGSTLYEVLDDPDLLVEIADWESAEAHEAVMRDPATAEALAPGLELPASPFKATILRQP